MPAGSWSGGGHTSHGITEERELSLAARSREHLRAQLRIKTLLFQAPCASLPLHLGSYVENMFQVAPLKALGSWQRRDLVLLILHPQGLAQNLAQSRCSINVCWMRKLLAGRAVSCHSRESDQQKQRLEVCTVRPMSRIQECGIR